MVQRIDFQGGFMDQGIMDQGTPDLRFSQIFVVPLPCH